MLFPENEFSLRAAEAKGRDEELVRVKIMKNAAAIKKPVFLSIRAFLGRVVPPEYFRKTCFELIAGKSYNGEELMKELAKNGYERVGRCV